MSERLSELPEDERVFEGSKDERLIALSLEALIHDVSIVGDRNKAIDLGGYMLGEDDPPEEVPEYVELDDGHISLENPPFLLAEIDIERRNGEYRLDIGFNSYLNLLIEPPVEVTLEDELDEVIDQLEQTIAEIYRTRGRHLEKIYTGKVTVG